MLTACNGNPTRAVTSGEVLVSDDFDAGRAWDQADKPAATVQIQNGAFRFEADAGRYIFSVDYARQTDTVIEVDALHLSDDDSDAYGLICRANADGEGYYFLIGSDGSGTIRRSSGREVTPLVAWTKTGGLLQNTANRIRAVCDGDYLALYVNGVFVGEARDSLFSGGYTGLVVTTTRRSQRITVEFDALRVYAAE